MWFLSSRSRASSSLLRRGLRYSATSNKVKGWVAPGALLVDDVEIDEGGSVWFGAVLRGRIRIGERSNVQDGAVLVGDVQIGKGVTIGHAARLQSCKVNDYCLVGIGAVVLDGAVLERNSQIAAGCVVPPGTIVPSGKIWAGNPGKELRDLRPNELSFLEESAAVYANHARSYKEGLTSVIIGSHD